MRWCLIVPGWMDDQILVAIIGVIGVLIGAAIAAGVAERDSRRDQIVSEAQVRVQDAQAAADAEAAKAADLQARADSAQTVGVLSTQVLELTKQVTGLDGRVQRLESENADLSARLDASLQFVHELVAWVAGGCHGEIPQPHASIHDRIDLSPLRGEIQLGEN